jgi:hypothetical protein
MNNIKFLKKNNIYIILFFYYDNINETIAKCLFHDTWKLYISVLCNELYNDK